MGFETYEHEDGRWYWYHPELGGGRSFDGALQWWMGREEARKAASTLAG
jgi:hypothetical protein